MLQTPQLLPALRQDLRLFKSAADEDGSPHWQLYDPLSNRYFRFSHTAFYLFKHWQAGLAYADFLTLLEAKSSAPDIELEDLTAFVDFVRQNNLTQNNTPEGRQGLYQQYRASRKNWFSWLIHNYLFIKMPLFRPDAFLTRLYPRVKWLFQPWVSIFFITLGLVGIFLVLRQWDTFLATFEHFFSWQGMAAYGLALIFVKSAHELGHALVSKRYQCKVSSMGVAFLVLFPVLYTDTTDAWKLRSKYQRLNIVTAGIRVELYLAMLATFLWAFLPDGSLRSIAFFVATTSWISSLLINVSPFLRFDGYYALSDLSGVENLQPRSFAVGRWYLRKLIFGLDELPPEPLNRKKLRFFVLYAWGTWLYRLVLFLGIALLVYYFAFKVLGIVLFAVEIIWFILLPIWREIKMWWKIKDKMTWNGSVLRSLMLLALLLGLLVYPWQGTVSVPALLKATDYQKIYPTESAQVVRIDAQVGQMVNKGDSLMALRSDDLEQEINKADLNLKSLEERYRRTASDKTQRESVSVLEETLLREQSKLATLLERQEQLIIRSSVTGQVVDKIAIQPGSYVNPKTPLFAVLGDSAWQVHAFIGANTLNSIKLGAQAIFISDEGEKIEVPFTVTQILPFAIDRLAYPELASIYEGKLAVREQDKELIPEAATYEVILTSQQPIKRHQRMVGDVIIEGLQESGLTKLQRHIYSVLIRESGF